MEELKDLEKLVEDLVKLSNDTAIVKKLQEIEQKLLTEYVINVDNVIIEPLWIEAYYYNKDKFPDCNTHMSENQKKLGKLYCHNIGRGGVDICLSTCKEDNNSSEYYLSFLIKAGLFKYSNIEKGEFKKQIDVYETLKSKTGKSREELNNTEDVLKKKLCDEKVCFAERINLTKPCYSDRDLAAFKLSAIGKEEYDFKFARKSIESIAVKYITEYIKNNESFSKKDYERECRKRFGWLPDSVGKLIKEYTE